MTAPADQTPPPPPAGPSAADVAAILTLTAFLTTAPLLATAAALAIPARLLAQVTTLTGISAPGFRAALTLTLITPRTHTPRPPARQRGPAARATARIEYQRRAAYLLNASRRITRTLTTTRGNRETRMRQAITAERRYHQQHLQARTNRARAAQAADQQATQTGPLLRWHAKLDLHTTPDCRALHNTVFHITNPPGGLYPGQKHSRCRCTAQAA